MLKRIAAVAVCLVLGYTSSVFGAEATITRVFSVKTKPDVVAKWLQDHPEEVAKATDTEIISQDGDKVRVRQETPKGRIEFTAKETVKENGGGYDYDSILVEVHEGPLEDQWTKVKIEPFEGGTKFSMELYAKVRNTKPIGVRTGLIKSARGFQELIERKF